MKKILLLLLGVSISAVAFADGFPSRPRFQAVGVGGAPPVSVGEKITLRGAAVGSANSSYVSFRDSAGTRMGYVGDASGAEGDVTLACDQNPCDIELLPGGVGVVNAGGVPVVTETSGNFTASFDAACSTTPTVTFGYVAAGNVVTIYIKSTAGFPCTGDSTSFATTGTPVPAAIRPTLSPGSVSSPVLTGCMDNTVAVGCHIALTTAGDVQFFRVTSAFASTGWTASGSRLGPNMSHGFTYYRTNP